MIFSDQKNLLMKNFSEINDIRNEILKYEQKLNRERLKCRALEEMLLKPTNVHRWRLLRVICIIIVLYFYFKWQFTDDDGPGA